MAATDTADTVVLTRAALWRCYLELTKPRVVALMVFTALVGMLLAADPPIPWPRAMAGLLGIALAAASGAAFNHLVDRRIDALMDRTRARPLPSGQLDGPAVLLFAGLLGATGTTVLLLWVNTLTALLTAAALIGYAVLYTVFLKRTTPQNIVWGGAAGAAPPLLGAVAVTGDIPLEGVLLFLIVFIWTPPHFWPLAIRRREEYARAGVPMLPLTHGVRFAKLQVLLYTVMLLGVTLLPFAVRMSGPLYLAGAVGLGVGFIRSAWVMYRSDDDRHAAATFRYSIGYLAALFTLLLVDRFVL